VWVNRSVKDCGESEAEKQQPVQKKLQFHKLPTAHIKACEVTSMDKNQCNYI
jgi:hypothetical protein